MDGPLLVCVAKEAGLGPKDLGVSDRYWRYLRRGEKKPSVELEERLKQLVAAMGLNYEELESRCTATLNRAKGGEAPHMGSAAVAQLAERRPGKAEVPGSNPGGGSTPPSQSHYIQSGSQSTPN